MTQINLPDGWENVELGDVLDQRNEMVQPTNNGLTRFVGLEHITSGETVINSWAQDIDIKSTKYRFYEGDILYGKLRPYLDKAAEASFNGICSTDILTLKPKIERESAKFLLYTIHSQPFIRYAMSHTSGTNHPRTSWKAIRKYGLALPPRDERHTIGSIIFAVYDAIQKSKTIIEKIEELKQGTIRVLLTKGIGHNEFRIDEKAGKLPVNWKVKPLNDLVQKFLNGGTPSTKETRFWGGNIPWTTSSPITKFFIDSGERHITQEGLENSASNLVPKGNVIFTTRVGLGKIAVNRIDIAINQDLTGLVVDKEQICPDYLARFLLAPWVVNRMKAIGRGTTIKGIIREDLEQIIVPVPPKDEQQRIATIISVIDNKLDLENQRNVALKQLKRGLVNDLLTGKLRVGL